MTTVQPFAVTIDVLQVAAPTDPVTVIVFPTTVSSDANRAFNASASRPENVIDMGAAGPAAKLQPAKTSDRKLFALA